MILVGVGLETLATSAGTIGKQLMRYSMLAEESGKVLCSHAALASGLVLNMLGGPILEVLAYGQAPQTLLAPLSGLDVLWNILLVPYTLHEIPTERQIYGCFLLVIGTAITAAMGPHNEREYTVEMIRSELLTYSGLTYIAVEAVLLVIGAAYIARQPMKHRGRGLVLGCVAGGIGGNLFCMKAAASLIQDSMSCGAAPFYTVWMDPLPWIITASAALIGLSSAFLLAHAMREYEATMMVATYEGAFVVSGCASGCAVLGELDVVDRVRRTSYAAGVALIVAGVLAAQGAAGDAPAPAKTNGKNAPLLADTAACP